MRSGELVPAVLVGLAATGAVVGVLSWWTGWTPPWLRGRQSPAAYGLTLLLIAGFLLLESLPRLLEAPASVVTVFSLAALLPMGGAVWVMTTGRHRAAAVPARGGTAGG